jgi:P27 family predicted phage terminase small subunit
VIVHKIKESQKMGRKPIAQEVKEAQGAFLKNPQRKAKSSPSADGKAPRMPPGFCRVAKAKWKELCADLERNGVLSTDTREMLIAYCVTFAKWMEARKKVEQTGLAVESFDKNGQLVISRNAYVAEMHKFREQLNKLLPEFGLTPASRQKLTSMKLDDGKEDPFAKIMERMGRG